MTTIATFDNVSHFNSLSEKSTNLLSLSTIVSLTVICIVAPSENCFLYPLPPFVTYALLIAPLEAETTPVATPLDPETVNCGLT